MQYGEFIAALRQRGLCQVYLLTGEEPYFIERARQRLLTAICPDETIWPELVERVEGDRPVPEVIERLTTTPFFTEKRVLQIGRAHV